MRISSAFFFDHGVPEPAGDLSAQSLPGVESAAVRGVQMEVSVHVYPPKVQAASRSAGVVVHLLLLLAVETQSLRLPSPGGDLQPLSVKPSWTMLASHADDKSDDNDDDDDDDDYNWDDDGDNVRGRGRRGGRGGIRARG
jgi:hypothetical protein